MFYWMSSEHETDAFLMIDIAFQTARHINVILSPFYYEWYLAYDRELHVNK